MEWNDLIGKTIANIQEVMVEGYDDEGFLRIDFTDGTKCLVIAGYWGEYTGKSIDEYRTYIDISEDVEKINCSGKFVKLIPKPDRP